MVKRIPIADTIAAVGILSADADFIVGGISVVPHLDWDVLIDATKDILRRQVRDGVALVNDSEVCARHHSLIEAGIGGVSNPWLAVVVHPHGLERARHILQVEIESTECGESSTKAVASD